MRKLANLFLAACMALMIASCSNGNTQNTPSLEAANPTQAEDIIQTPSSSTAQQEPELPFEGKIAIISHEAAANEIEYRFVRTVAMKYGGNKVVHATWPVSHWDNQEQIIDIVSRLGADPDIKVIISDVIPGSNAAFTELMKIRDDIFIIYIASPYIGFQEVSVDDINVADIVLADDELGLSLPMVQQAYKLGAKTFVHYSFPRDMEKPIFAARRGLIMAECEKLGIKFVDATTPDPASDTGIWGARQFILEDVPKVVAKYGKDTAFFCTSGALQIPLIKSAVDSGAIYPQPCHSTYSHVFGGALDIIIPYEETNDIRTVFQSLIKEIIPALDEKGVLGRFSTWPMPSSVLLADASVEYAIKWLNGEVPKEGADVEVLKQIMEDYAGVEVFLTLYKDEYPYTENGTGETYNNFLLVRMDYITFE